VHSHSYIWLFIEIQLTKTPHKTGVGGGREVGDGGSVFSSS
jgi:hypothetical protein